MYNRIILIGRLVRDPELRYVPSGQPVARFSLAVDRPFVTQGGERKTDFFTVVAWRKLAEQASQHLVKGRLVAVEGRLEIRDYETAAGERRRAVEVVADNIRFLDRKPGPAEVEEEEVPDFEPPVETDEDVPF